MAIKKRKKRKPKALTAEFLQWVAEYNMWRNQFGYPSMVATLGLEALWFCVLRSAKMHEEPFPSWDDLTVGAEMGPIGSGFSMGSSIWMLLPRGVKGEGHLVDKNLLKMARWGKKAEASDTRQGYMPSGGDSAI